MPQSRVEKDPVNDPVLPRHVTFQGMDDHLHTDNFLCLENIWVKVECNQAALGSLNCSRIFRFNHWLKFSPVWV